MSDFRLLNKNMLKEEIQKLNQKENSIFGRAKEIEQEMEALRSEKIDLLVNLYRDQLVADAKVQKENFLEESSQNHERDLKELAMQKERKMKKLNDLHKKIEEQIVIYQMVLKDIKEKKEELETAYLAAKEYVKVEKQKSIDNFNVQVLKSVENKVEEFRNQVKDQSFAE